jgi:hypothetical protein
MSAFPSARRPSRVPPRARRWALLPALAVIAACASGRAPAPAELEPLDPSRPAVPRLHDEMERAAGRLAALALADQEDAAAQVLGLMRDEENARRARDLPPTGLADAAEDVVVALGGHGAYLRHAERALEEDLDPARRRRMERALASQPLQVAERALAQERQVRLARWFNRAVAPASRLAVTGQLPAFLASRELLGSLLVAREVPTASVRERKALAAQQEFLRRYPDAPEASELRQEVRRRASKLAHHRWEAAMKAARLSYQRGADDAALAYLERADRVRPGQEATRELRQQVVERRASRQAAIRATLRAAPAAAAPGADAETVRALAVELLTQPDAQAGQRARQALERPGTPLPELMFASALELRGPAQDAAFFERLAEVARLDVHPNPMRRHAEALLRSPLRNPYPAYQAARSAAGGQRRRWLLLGPLSSGPRERELPRPVEYLIDTPALATSVASMPMRLAGYRSATRTSALPAVPAGERYTRRFPAGRHAQEVHRALEQDYARAGLWARALEHNQALDHPDAKDARRYREQLAEALLEVAKRETRLDMKASIYRALVADYPDTAGAARARQELAELARNASPQNIRLSRQFLNQHPEVSGAGGLGLRAELLDGRSDNGEIAENGVVLVGRSFVRIELEDREPVLQELPPERFARLAALLDEASYRALLRDEREKPVSDPQRDRFFERARLGLLDTPDARPTARSDAEFLGSREKHGMVRTRGSVLPIELVLRGDLQSLGLAAVPRIRIPELPEDAFLYE